MGGCRSENSEILCFIEIGERGAWGVKVAAVAFRGRLLVVGLLSA